MKQRIKLFFIIINLCAFEIVIGQTASEYYLPLKIGNYLKFHTTLRNSNWSARTTTYSIEGSDVIFDQQYYREKAIEILDEDNGLHIFRVFWLAQISGGNIALGAMNISNGSSNIDSAMLVNVGNWFPNEFLTKGYSRTFPQAGLTYQDSVISTNANITTLAGTFTNCLEISDKHFDSNGNTVFYEIHYFAPGIGMVENVRLIPENESHTDELIEYVVNTPTGLGYNESKQVPGNFSLRQNFPNPFNPTTNISFSLNERSFVSLKIFDLTGREIATIVSEELNQGDYSFRWNAVNIESGIYFYRIQAGKYTETKKLVLIK